MIFALKVISSYIGVNPFTTRNVIEKNFQFHKNVLLLHSLLYKRIEINFLLLYILVYSKETERPLNRFI